MWGHFRFSFVKIRADSNRQVYDRTFHEKSQKNQDFPGPVTTLKTKQVTEFVVRDDTDIQKVKMSEFLFHIDTNL